MLMKHYEMEWKKTRYEIVMNDSKDTRKEFRSRCMRDQFFSTERNAGNKFSSFSDSLHLSIDRSLDQFISSDGLQ